MFLGGAGGPGAGLRPSLFLNRPTLLPMAAGASMGLISAVRASPPPSVSRMSPDSCSASPCSSPASFCSFSEASPPPLGGAMAEWHPQWTISLLEGEESVEQSEHKKPRLFNQSHLSLLHYSPSLPLSTSRLKPKIHRMKERGMNVGEQGRRREQENQKFDLSIKLERWHRRVSFDDNVHGLLSNRKRDF